jgi:hypothetical protein
MQETISSCMQETGMGEDEDAKGRMLYDRIRDFDSRQDAIAFGLTHLQSSPIVAQAVRTLEDYASEQNMLSLPTSRANTRATPWMAAAILCLHMRLSDAAKATWMLWSVRLRKRTLRECILDRADTDADSARQDTEHQQMILSFHYSPAFTSTSPAASSSAT